MEKYIGTKIIEAEPAFYCKDGGGNTAVALTRDAADTYPDVREGYRVRYQDGYESWSPKDVFEAAYRRTGSMSFGLAIEAAKAGHKIQREGWNGKGQYVELATCISYKNASGEVVNVNHDAIGNAALAFVGTSGVQLGWLASQADMLADVWRIVE